MADDTSAEAQAAQARAELRKKFEQVQAGSTDDTGRALKPPSQWANEKTTRPKLVEEACAAKGWRHIASGIDPLNQPGTPVSEKDFDDAVAAVPQTKVMVVVSSRPEYPGYWCAGRFLKEGPSIILASLEEFKELVKEVGNSPIAAAMLAPEDAELSATPDTSSPTDLSEGAYQQLLKAQPPKVVEEVIKEDSYKGEPVRTTKRTVTTKGPLGG